MNFYKREKQTVPSVGDEFEGKTVTAVYDNIENLVNSYGNSVEPGWFDLQTKIQSVDFVDKIKPKSVSKWFCKTENLKELDFSNVDLSEVKDLSNLFGIEYYYYDEDGRYLFYTSGITTISNFDLSGVSPNYVGSMFANCPYLTSIDLSGLDVSNVQYFDNMFKNCYNLTSIIGLDTWDTSNAVHMAHMFYNCSNLGNLEALSNWDVSNVKYFSEMFCVWPYDDVYGEFVAPTRSIDLSSWDVSSGTDFYNMFASYNCSWECESFGSLENWDMSNARSMNGMFRGLHTSSIGDISNWDISNAEVIESMFAYCVLYDDTYIDFSNWDFSSVTDWRNFVENSGFVYIDFSGCDFSNKNNPIAYGDDILSLISHFGGKPYGWEPKDAIVDFSDVIWPNTYEFVGTNGYDSLDMGFGGTILVNETFNDIYSSVIDANYMGMDYAVGGLGSTITGAWDTWPTSMFKVDAGESNPGILTPKITVSYQDADGNMLATSQLYKYGIVAPSYDADGFIGWARTVDATEVEFSAGDKVLYDPENPFEDIVLYPVFGAKAVAFAVYSADDNSLNFYKRDVVPSVGDEFEGLTVTAVYTGLEDNPSVSGKSAWSDFASQIQSVNIVDDISPVNTAYWFYDCRNLINVDLTNLDTSNVTNMRSMFSYCESLVDLDLSNFDTLNVSDIYGMAQMFLGCKNLTSLDVSSFNTSNVTSMQGMFHNCSSLITLDVSGFDTSNVENMNSMFNGCSKLTTLDVSGFDVSNVSSTSGITGQYGLGSMFNNCSSLTALDVSKWDTSSVKTMSNMFNYCTQLTSLDVSKWDISNVTDITNMFQYCTKLTDLDVSEWDTSNVTRMIWVFCNCERLTDIDVSNWNTSNVNSMRGLFQGCKLLENIDVSNFDTSNVTNMSAMFLGCSKLETLGLSNFDTSSVTDISSMFSGCNKLTNLDISSFNTSNVTNMSSVFRDCWRLESIDLSKWDTLKVTNMGSMFFGCSKLSSIYVSNLWNTANVTSSSNMFVSCAQLPNYDKSVEDKTNAHYGEGGYLTYEVAPVNAVSLLDTVLGMFVPEQAYAYEDHILQFECMSCPNNYVKYIGYGLSTDMLDLLSNGVCPDCGSDQVRLVCNTCDDVWDMFDDVSLTWKSLSESCHLCGEWAGATGGHNSLCPSWCCTDHDMIGEECYAQNHLGLRHALLNIGSEDEPSTPATNPNATDADGKLVFYGVGLGNYLVTETDNPDARYLFEDGESVTLTTAITDDGTVVATTTADTLYLGVKSAAADNNGNVVLTLTNMKATDLAVTGGAAVGGFGFIVLAVTTALLFVRRKSQKNMDGRKMEVCL